MPLDTSIAIGIKPPEVQNPLQSLGQMMQIKQMQQGIASNEVLMQEHQLQAEKLAKQQHDQQVVSSLLSAPNFNRDTFLEAVRTQAPDVYSGVMESYAKLDSQAATTDKAIKDAQEASARAAASFQGYLANSAAEVKARKYDPVAFVAAAQHAKQAFPMFASHVDDYLKQAANGTPIDSIVDGLISENTAQAKQVAEQPGQVAKSKEQENVTANMQGGMTAEQRAADAARKTQLALEAQRVELEKKKFALQGGTDVDPARVAFFAKQYAADPALGDKMISGQLDSKALKMAVTKALADAGQPVTQLDSQSKLMKTAATSILPMIDKVQGLAKQVSALGLMGTIGGRWRKLVTGESAASDIEGLTPEQKTLVGQFASEAGLLNSAVARAHGGARGGGSVQMLAYMRDLLGAQTKDLPTYLGSLEGARAWMQDYANMGTPTLASGGGTADFVWNPDTKKLEPAKK